MSQARQQPAPGNSRGNPSLADIVRTVAVMGVILLAIFGLGQLVTMEPEHPVREVDYLEAAKGADNSTSFTPLVFDPAPGRATSATFSAVMWRAGFVTSADEFVGLFQSSRPIDTVLDDEVVEAEAAGTETIDGRTWDVYEEADGDVHLVTTWPGDTETVVIVLGSVGRDALVDYASSLVAAPAS